MFRCITSESHFPDAPAAENSVHSFVGRLLCISFGISPEPVFRFCSFCTCKDQIDYREQQPPATVLCVVHSSHAYAERRKEDRKLVDQGQDALIALRCDSCNPLNKSQDERNNHIEQEKHPVFLSTCPSREYCVLLQHCQIPIHDFSPVVPIVVASSNDRDHRCPTPHSPEFWERSE